MGGEPPHTNLEDVKNAVGEMKTEHLFCRNLRHPWDEATSSVRDDGSTLYWTIECARCGTLRVFAWDAETGANLKKDRYSYPDGYRFKGLGRIGVAGTGALRVEMIRRIRGA
jgi:hypothetical protein